MHSDRITAVAKATIKSSCFSGKPRYPSGILSLTLVSGDHEEELYFRCPNYHTRSYFRNGLDVFFLQRRFRHDAIYGRLTTAFRYVKGASEPQSSTQIGFLQHPKIDPEKYIKHAFIKSMSGMVFDKSKADYFDYLSQYGMTTTQGFVAKSYDDAIMALISK